ncbi:hypothetical protein MBLNU459_g0234t1 [Dothideomycetes sp. NU459]
MELWMFEVELASELPVRSLELCEVDTAVVLIRNTGLYVVASAELELCENETAGELLIKVRELRLWEVETSIELLVTELVRWDEETASGLLLKLLGGELGSKLLVKGPKLCEDLIRESEVAVEPSKGELEILRWMILIEV